MRHTDDEMRAMVRKYTMEGSSHGLEEFHRLNHVVQEMKFMIAVNLGFNDFAHLERTLLPVAKQSTLSFVEKHNLGRRVDDEDRQRGGGL